MSAGYWHNKVAIVTGGTAGLGQALVSSLACSGAHTVIVARDAERIAELERQLQSRGASALGISADVTQPEAIAALVETVRDRFGRIDAWISCAGRSSRGEAWQTAASEFQQLWELNFLATLRCAQAAAPFLIASHGHLVNIGSLAAKSAGPYLGAYPSSKFPVAALSQQLRYELGPRGVHVLLVCPGPIAREDAGRRYNEQATGLPESARRPGGGVKLRGIPPERLATLILQACQRRRPELVVPSRARWLFAFSQLWPSLGDRIVLRMMGRRDA